MAPTLTPSAMLHQSRDSQRAHTLTSLPRRVTTRGGLMLCLLTILVALSSTAVAQEEAYPPHITAPALLDLSGQGLILDTRPAPSRGLGIHDLRRRQKSNDEDEEAPPKDRTTTSSSSKKDDDKDDKTSTSDVGTPTTMSTSVRSSTSGTSSPTADASPSPLPKPFDDAIPADFRGTKGGDSCPVFVSNLLSDASFLSCYPVSMMIQTSRSFFNAQKQLTSIVNVLDAACSADVTYCTDYLDGVAKNFTANENCGREYNEGITEVVQAYNGLKAYKTLYSATCLQDPDADMYCYATAVTNTTNPSDTYLYFMPYGKKLPGASTPSCNWCTKETMGIFHSASAHRSQLISDTYEDAASQVNTICGPNFVDSELPPAESASRPTDAPKYIAVLAGFIATVALSL